MASVARYAGIRRHTETVLVVLSGTGDSVARVRKQFFDVEIRCRVIYAQSARGAWEVSLGYFGGVDGVLARLDFFADLHFRYRELTFGLEISCAQHCEATLCVLWILPHCLNVTLLDPAALQLGIGCAR